MSTNESVARLSPSLLVQYPKTRETIAVCAGQINTLVLAIEWFGRRLFGHLLPVEQARRVEFALLPAQRAQLAEAAQVVPQAPGLALAPEVA